MVSVGILLQKASDWGLLHRAASVLEQFRIPYERRLISKHRAPEQLVEYTRATRKRGIQVIIIRADREEWLAERAAAHLSIPLIAVAVPIETPEHLTDNPSTPSRDPRTFMIAPRYGPLSPHYAGELAIRILANSRPDLAAYVTRIDNKHGFKQHPRA